MEDRWFGNEFQILGATDENDLEVAVPAIQGMHLSILLKEWSLQLSKDWGHLVHGVSKFLVHKA